MPAPVETPSAVAHRWRFASVLGAGLLLAIVQPLLAQIVPGDVSFDLCFSLLIVTVLALIFEHRGHRRPASAIAVAAILGIAAGYAVGGFVGRAVIVIAQLVAAGLFSLALYFIIREALSNSVSGDALFGAICGYLLLGIIWATLYSAVEITWPGSFNFPAADLVDESGVAPRGALNYYSFVTLSTVGYGDVTPRAPLARTLACLEAIAGQFYLAVLVAGLVSLRVTHALARRAAEREDSGE